MTNAELFDHLMETNAEFRERYKGLAESVAKEEGTFFNKAWAWVARNSIEAKQKQDEIIEKVADKGKKTIFYVGIAICIFIVVKFNLLKDIKAFFRELKK